jgi:hypothetical protein
MKLKVLTYSIGLNVALFGLLMLTAQKASKSAAGYNRVLKANDLLSSEMTSIVEINGRVVSQNQVLELKNKELKALIPQLHQEIEYLKVKPSRTESVSSTAFTAQTQIKTLLRDSTIFDTVEVKRFTYTDEFYQIEGYAVNDTQHLSITYQDTLIQTVYRGRRKRPWLWVFSPRQLEQRVALKNPNASIDYSQIIHIKKP